jgi:ABC-type phosphate/phosphonate transport system substrate-binding protein
MERYCRHSVSGIYVGEDMPKELIEKAYENIKNMPEEELKEKLDAFNERDKQLKQDEERYREREEYEDACIGDIKNGEFGEDGLYWFM